MAQFQNYLHQIQDVKLLEINAAYKNQFKMKETMLNASSRNFESIVAKFLEEENHGAKRKWDKQCKLFYIWFLIKYMQSQGKKTINPTEDEWAYFEEVLNINKEVLKGRWITLINQQAKSVSWNSQEDDIIKKLMCDKDQKHIWTQIAVELYNHNNGEFVRTPKQVRERWMNYLNPALKKDDWTAGEDTMLLNLVVQLGKRWSHIAQMIEGRTENQVKNKYKSLINKILKNDELDDVDEIEAIQDYLKQQKAGEIQEAKQPKPQNTKSIKTPAQEEPRPKLKREAKEKQQYYLKLQKEKEEYVDNIIEKQIEFNEVTKKPKIEQPKQQFQQQQMQQQQIQPAPTVQREQKLVNQQSETRQQPSIEQMILLGLSNYAGCDTNSMEGRRELSTPMSSLSFNQQGVNEFLRQYQRVSPVNVGSLLDVNKFEPRAVKTPDNLVQSQTAPFQSRDHKGFRPYQGEKSPLQIMSETQQINQLYQQFQNTMLQQQTPTNPLQSPSAELLKMFKNQAMLQVGVSPMQQIMSPYGQQGMFYNPLHFCLQQQQMMLQSPSMMLSKSPYRPQNDISPYLQPMQDFQMPLPTPTPRREDQPQTPMSSNMHFQYPSMSRNVDEPVPQPAPEQEVSFDFLKESNLISRWKNKRSQLEQL